VKRILLFGSTGSIGRNVLDIVAKNRDKFRVELISCHNNVKLLIEQATVFKVPAVHLSDQADAETVRRALPSSTRIFTGDEAFAETIQNIDAELVVNAIVGAAGLKVSYHALAAGRTLALANKESLVTGGELLKQVCRETGAQIIPIDSEHSAVFQCLKAGRQHEVEKIILTASGGPFRNRPKGTFGSITIEEALKHPNWSMGAKITIDSATMMNKCLEVIEAHFLFDVTPEQIEVVIHPESVIHSMVQFCDGSVIAQLSPPDMRLPIAYALEYPKRLATDLPRTDFSQLKSLHFEPVDLERFPAIALAYKVLRMKGLAALTLNAANEMAVAAFLAGRIKLPDIYAVVDKMVIESKGNSKLSLNELVEADRQVRKRTEEVIASETFIGR
jgi:1-deoxy-D-xylulose-5-phosphate reductoisomerase